MSQTTINIVGLVILAAMFYYVQYYRPAKQLADPEDLEVKKVSPQLVKLVGIITKNFSDKFSPAVKVRLDDLIYSPRMSKNQMFRKQLATMRSDIVLFDKLNGIPVFTIQLVSNSNNKQRDLYLNAAGLGCLYISDVENESEVIESVEEAVASIEAKNSENSLQPAI